MDNGNGKGPRIPQILSLLLPLQLCFRVKVASASRNASRAPDVVVSTKCRSIVANIHARSRWTKGRKARGRAGRRYTVPSTFSRNARVEVPQ